MAPMPSAELATTADVRAVGDDVRDLQLLWATIDSPWVHNVDPARFRATVDPLRALGASAVFSSHLPPVPQPDDRSSTPYCSHHRQPRSSGPTRPHSKPCSRRSSRPQQSRHHYCEGVLRAAPTDLLPHLRRARDLMDSCYAEDLDVATVAERAGVSKYHFIRSFNAEYGQTPAQYLAHRRIERAQDLLRATNLTVTEVCMLVGYSSLGSFSAKFRSLVGESPLEFQQRYGGNGVPHIPGCYIFMRGLQERAISEKPAEARRH